MFVAAWSVVAYGCLSILVTTTDYYSNGLRDKKARTICSLLEEKEPDIEKSLDHHHEDTQLG